MGRVPINCGVLAADLRHSWAAGPAAGQEPDLLEQSFPQKAYQPAAPASVSTSVRRWLVLDRNGQKEVPGGAVGAELEML